MFRICCLLFFLGFVSVAEVNAVTKLVVTPEHRIMLLNETLTFTVTANFSAPENALKLNTLENHFDVQSVEFEQYSHLINLQQSTSSTWTIDAKPKRLGELVLPPLTVNNASSTETIIRVLSQNTETGGSRPDVFIESTLSPKQGFVKQPRLYSVSIYSATNITRPELDISFPDTLVVKSLPTTSDENLFKAGRRYGVTTHHYLLLPQIDGDFVLPAPTLTGTLRERNKGSFGQLYTREDMLYIKSAPSQISVLSTPESFDSQWLPAQSLNVSMRWQTDPENIVQGQPAMLELFVQAEGLEDTALPDLALPLPKTLRAYPDKPISETKIEDGTLLSSKSVVIALVPEQAGEVTIPALEIPWFNTRTQQVETAALPSQTLLVASNDTFTTNQQYITSTSIEKWFWPGTCAVLLAYSIFATLKPRKLESTIHSAADVILPKPVSHKDPLPNLLSCIDSATSASLVGLLSDYFNEIYGKKKTLHEYAVDTGSQRIQGAVDSLYQYQYGGIGDLYDVREDLKLALKQLDSEKKSNPTLHFFQKRNTFKE